MATTEAGLSSWHDGPAKQAIVELVARVSGADGSEPCPVGERLAVFDNDCTLWCEKPMPIQLDFILRRLVEMAEAEPSLRERQPWKAAHERDYGRLSKLMAAHYAGDDSNVMVLAAGILAAYDGISVEDFEAQANASLRNTKHPTLGRGYLETAYGPMVDLLDYLTANGFSNYIASGGGRDFMRPIGQDVYGIPRQRVIGTSAALAYTSDERGGTITHKPESDYLDDGPQKPIRIWSRTGRRPLLAAGNSNGDVRPGGDNARGQPHPGRRQPVAGAGRGRQGPERAGRRSPANPKLDRLRPGRRTCRGRRGDERCPAGSVSPSSS